MNTKGTPAWVGFDLDGTLAEYCGWDDGKIGKPIPRVIQRLKEHLDAGDRVCIFTARCAHSAWTNEDLIRLQNWCLEHIGQVLHVTCKKDMGMVVFYDDRARQVVMNTGIIVEAS